MKKNKTKGVLIAGGYGSRLYPITKVVSKHLLPVYDKPLIYYSLSNLILCGVFEICIVTQEKNIKIFKELLNEFSNFGIKIIAKSILLSIYATIPILLFPSLSTAVTELLPLTT